MRLGRAATVSLIVLALMGVLAVLGPLFSPWHVADLDWGRMAVPPGLDGSHWFGTDRLGRDLFVRTLGGLRVSLLIALLATLVSLLIGVSYGAVAGYLGGRIDAFMMRLVDVFYSLPYVFFVILLTVSFGRHPVTVFVAIGAVGWLTVARVVRGEAEKLRGRGYVEAAIVVGVPTRWILWRHVLPNLAGPVLVYATLTVPGMILLESFLSFLGLGVAEPAASLGNLLADGAREMESVPWMLLVPGGFLVAIVVALGLIGEGLRDALDVHAG